MTFLIVQLYIGQKHGQYATFNFDLDVSATDVDNNDESVNKHMQGSAFRIFRQGKVMFGLQEDIWFFVQSICKILLDTV